MEIKVQCECGTRYSFDAEPVDGHMPVRVSCPACGADGTRAANDFIRHAALSVPPVAGVRLQSAPPPSAALQEAQPAQPAAEFCHRHSKYPAANHCLLCSKPMCLECMSQFGYVCSVGCRYQAEQRGIKVPRYEFQKSVLEEKEWKKAGRVYVLIGAVAAAVIGLAGWYQFVGSEPRQFYSKKLAGQERPLDAKFAGKDKIVLLDSSKAVLLDLKSGKEVWSAPVRDGEKSEPRDPARFASLGATYGSARPRWHFEGDQLWIASAAKIFAIDLKSGTRRHETAIAGKLEELMPAGESLFVLSSLDRTRKVLTRVDFPSGTITTQQFVVPPAEVEFIANSLPPGVEPTAAFLVRQELEGGIQYAIGKFYTEFVAAGSNVLQMQVKLVEPNLVAVQAMKKAGPSVLGSQTSASTSAGAFAEELFNELKRNRTGGVRMVDQSRYGVTLRRLMAGESQPWNTEVSGPPAFFPQKTVDVLVAGTNLFLFDKENRQLATARLAYPVGELFMGRASGIAPCAEIDNVLYFFDQGVLTAFDLPSGKIRWRLTSVGISRVQSDGQGNLYINTTSASPEDIQYSEQIKLTDQTVPLLLKVDAQTGKVLWKVKTGEECYLSGKFVYATRRQGTGMMPLAFGLSEALGTRDREGAEHFRIYRHNPRNGNRSWEFYNKGAPRRFDFHENRILLLFEEELRVLKFFSL